MSQSSKKSCSNCKAITQPPENGLFVCALTSAFVFDLENDGCNLDPFGYRNLCLDCTHSLFKNEYGNRAELYLAGLQWNEHTEWLIFEKDAAEWWIEFCPEREGRTIFFENISRLNDARLFGISPKQLKGWKSFVKDPFEWLDQMKDWAEWDIHAPSDLQELTGKNLLDNPFELEYPPPIELKTELKLSLSEVAAWWENGFQYDGESPYELIPIFLKWKITAKSASELFRGVQNLFDDSFELLTPDHLDKFLQVLSDHSIELTNSLITGWWVFVVSYLDSSIDEFSQLLSEAEKQFNDITIDSLVTILNQE